MKLPETSIRRPVFAVMLIGGLVVLGIVSIPRLGVDLFPRVEFPLVTVTTVLEGAAPDTMEREVSQVIEEAINTIEGIKSLRSASSDSLSLIFVEFGLEYDIQAKTQEVRDKVAEVRGGLPRDLEPPVVGTIDPDSAPILAVMLAGPQGVGELSEFADKFIKPRLERVPGVGSVSLVGGRAREIRIWIDPIRLTGYALAVDDVLSALQREHIEMPAGRIATQHGEFTLKTKGKITSPEGFGDIVVVERAGRTVHLRDVATVEDGMAEERTLSQLNGRRGVALLIRRQSGQNTVAVVDAVKKQLVLSRAALPPGYELVEAMDSSRFIRTAVRDVAVDLAWGAVLASITVLLFLRNARSTLIAAVAIPSSLLGSLVFFYFFGFTLNTMTLMALSLSIGILIDDAIVVLENVYRHVEEGEEPAAAALKGTNEIALAVVATTLSLCAVFVPIAFMGGVVGRFFREFGLVATSAILISMLVSLTLTPMMCSRFLRRGHSDNLAFRLLDSGYTRIENHYRRVLAAGLRHRGLVMGMAFLAVAGGVFIARRVPVDFIASEDRSEFNLWLKMPLGSTIDQSNTAVRALEAQIRSVPEIRTVFSTIGGGVKKRVNEALVYVQLTPKGERRRSQTEIMIAVRDVIRRAGLPFDDFAVEEVPLINFPGARSAQIMYALRGPDIDQLQRNARGLMARMQAAGGYTDLYLSYETGKPEIALDIARGRAADLGVPAMQIGRTIAALFAGFKATTFEDRGERYDVRVQVRPEYRDDPGKLDLVRVRAPNGALVPLRNLVSPIVGSGPVQIDRENRTRAVTLSGNLEGKSAGQANEEVLRFARELGVGGEYEIQPVGSSERLQETTRAVIFAFALALVAIYMLLASQFNSFIHPLTIMLSAPLSFIGAFASIWILGMSLDLMAQIAFLMLMGVVMKNSILLVDYTNTLRDGGMGLYEAVTQAGPTRLRPVLMTAVATVFGMLPVALSSGDGSEWRNPMGVISIGGLVTSTLLTLLVVPVVYTLFDDAERWLRRLVSRARPVQAPAPANALEHA